MRWRIKFVLLGVGVLFVVRIYTASQTLLFRGLDEGIEVVESAATLIAMLVVLRGLLRSRQVNTDVYPSLSVLQGSLTISLAGLYLLVVGLFAKLSTFWGGDSAFTLKAFIVLVSLVGLAVLLQSDRVQLRVRHFLIRNFQRPLYDYRAIWRKFTQATNGCVEQTELCRAIVHITADIFQALAVSLWLVNEQRSSFTLAASTASSPTGTANHAPSPSEVHEVVSHFEHRPEPVDIETRDSAWATTLRHWHPSDFPNGGHRVCVPLLRQNQLIGLIIMGDRVKGVSFPLQDFDLLKCIADQAAAKLLNLQLSRRLVQTKEVEAFQTMATFLVHDLKNAASTLNLMLQNMPVHFSDPAFREDALRGMGKTVNHINGLIARLGQFRNQLVLQPTPHDLNEIVQTTLADFPTSPEIAVSSNLIPLPTLMLDREQMQKVVLNLLLNATEACQGRGAVRIATAQQNGTAVLSVADNGCGMSADFLQGALFRPFKTTKKNGLGIGMFQSKMIIEAHGGNIAVTSAPGKGATFEIFLPLADSLERTQLAENAVKSLGGDRKPSPAK
jgi:putative PEP-CTERM system histidine kinase